MSFWSTKSSDNRHRDYIVLKHKLRGINYKINGVTFRDGWGVVERNSKAYSMLRKMPILDKAEERPLAFLNTLNFITRPSDVRTVYGVDVYRRYLEELDKKIEADTKVEEVKKVEEKKEEERLHVEESAKCNNRTRSGGLCNRLAVESPSRYCHIHILYDPKLKELGIDVPKFIPKDEKKKVRDSVIKKLAKLKKEGKF